MAKKNKFEFKINLENILLIGGAVSVVLAVSKLALLFRSGEGSHIESLILYIIGALLLIGYIITKYKTNGLKYIAVLILISATAGFVMNKYLNDFYHNREVKTFTEKINKNIEDLQENIGGFPPRIDSEEERKEVEEKLKSTISDGEALLKLVEKDSKEKQAYANYLLGELHRMGHNIDNPGSWQKAKDYLKEALVLDPNLTKAKFTLAFHYVNSDIGLAKDAEEMFREVLENMDSLSEIEKINTYRGLMFALYFQGKATEAEAIVEEGLSKFPDSQSLKNDKELFSVIRNSR